jgi:hypothetical protein
MIHPDSTSRSRLGVEVWLVGVVPACHLIYRVSSGGLYSFTSDSSVNAAGLVYHGKLREGNVYSVQHTLRSDWFLIKYFWNRTVQISNFKFQLLGMEGRNRRKSECGVVKGAGQSEVAIRLCWCHMFSETSSGIFVFRVRETPSCTTTCVKLEFHVPIKNTRSHRPNPCFWFGDFSCF